MIYNSNPWKTILHQFYFLQLEGYETGRYLKTLFEEGAVQQQRKQIDWTSKAKLVFGLALFIQITFSLIIAAIIRQIFNLNFFGLLVTIIVLLVATSYASFIAQILSLTILSPLDKFLKKRIIKSAQAKILRYPNLKIIGIAGSYGKTSMKETLYTVLSQRFKVLKASENINTPLGISRLIETQLDETVQVFIVEMGEYYRGDIQEICEITPPDISIITGINEAHLERLGSLDTTIETVFEIITFAKPEALVLLNADNENITKNYSRFLGNRKHQFYSAKQNLSGIEILGAHFSEEGDGQVIQLRIMNYELQISVPILAEYIIGVINGCIQIGLNLGMSIDEIRTGISRIKPVEHRLQPIKGQGGVLVIDDSYNGNRDGVIEAIKVLSKFKQRRKLFLTPGLVELGEKSQEVHQEIGRNLAQVVDLVLLIKTSSTKFIAEGLEQMNFPKERIIWFETTQIAHSSLGDVLRPDDVILFQNDWTDNYR